MSPISGHRLLLWTSAIPEWVASLGQTHRLDPRIELLSHAASLGILDKETKDLRINEISTLPVEEIQYLKCHVLVAFAHELFPCFTKVASA